MGHTQRLCGGFAGTGRRGAAKRYRARERVEAAGGWQRALRRKHAERARLLIRTRRSRASAVSDRRDRIKPAVSVAQKIQGGELLDNAIAENVRRQVTG